MLRLITLSLALALLPATAHAATEVSMVSSGDDFLGDGQTYHYDATNTTEIRGGGTPISLGVGVALPPYGFTDVSMSFQSPVGQRFQAGRTYSGFVLTRGNESSPKAKVNLDLPTSNACDTADGQFTINELTYHGNRVRTLALTFVHVCNGKGSLRGTVLYHAGEGATAPLPSDKATDVYNVLHHGALWAFRMRAALAAVRAAPRDKPALAALRFELRNWRTALRQAPKGAYEQSRRSGLKRMERALRTLKTGPRAKALAYVDELVTG